MSEAMRRPVVATILVVAGLVALRLLAAALTPLTFDEAYYWTWSKNLALSYFDHPPMVAVVIRLGTLIAGDTEFGVRLVSILLAVPMSWAVWRAAVLLFEGERIAATATLLLNATMMVSAGTTIVTPDAPLLVASSFVLLALAKVAATGRGVWWLAVGVAVGLALLSKYTALFFGPAILIWLLWVPSLRRWLISPWPYLGGVIAFALFSPVVIWNAEHDWISFVKQFGRAKLGGFEPKFLAELIPTQFVLATPFVFILGVVGLIALGKRGTGPAASRVLVGATVWTIALYFAWQALHDRVEANWLSPLYPAFALAAAVGAAYPHWKPGVARLVSFCRRWAVSTGAVLFALVVVQVNTGTLTGYRRDATVRSVGVGVAEMVAQIDQVRRRVGATCVLTDDYGTTGWLAFYLPPGTCVVQRGERFRWLAAPAPTPRQLAGPLLLVGVDNAAARPDLQAAFGSIERVGAVTRSRGPLLVDAVALDALSEPKGPILDFRPPIY
ncbi:glycosyltransferase family 39 protein [Rhodopseudomonas palustris]|uniref:glycosyltransferase family 39 protein n=1 Tax=Rhodopseudomonas palustris TaxID=1076 RepID=UPI00115EBE71|nr:glycosyltransferase family 39 protein [Rhodopseudomonas palustris]QDL98422.1 glycosyltransferase family 39 protein [Rhodopseudomonas palustris]